MLVLGEINAMAGKRLLWTAGQATDAQLGALQIGENGDRPTRLSLNCAHDIVARLMLVMGAVAEIEAEHVCCRLKQSTYHLRARACRPERGYDLCVTAAVHD